MSARRRKGPPSPRNMEDDNPISTSESGPDTPLLSDQHEVDEDPDVTTSNNARMSRPLLHRLASSFAIPLTDQTGSPSNILLGLFNLAIIGTTIGLAVPKDTVLPTLWYRLVSSMIGYTYFCAWSISFYPQVILNYKRKSTAGLSNDFSVLNVVGFACYATYTLCLYCSPAIQKMYKERNGDDAEITVQSNDVAFAVHALALCVAQVSQIWWYKGFDGHPLSKPVKIGLALLIIVCAVYAWLVVSHFQDLIWLDYLYLLSFVKVIISIVKYIPQVILNYNRKSTIGWNIWNIILDFTGGTLSLVQQIGDSADLHDFTGITGNPAKFALGFVSMFFDVIFFVQHYVLYPEDEGEDVAQAEEADADEPLLDGQVNKSDAIEAEEEVDHV